MGIIKWLIGEKFPVTDKDHHIFTVQDSEKTVTRDLYDLLKMESPPADVLWLLGDIFYKGRFDVSRDEARGLYYYHKAADIGDEEAQYLLGLHYSDINIAKSVHYLRLAAQQNHGDAQWQLAYTYLAYLDKYPKKILAAMQLFCRSHLQGNKNAAEQLEKMIEVDKGIDDSGDMKRIIKRTLNELKKGQKPMFGNDW